MSVKESARASGAYAVEWSALGSDWIENATSLLACQCRHREEGDFLREVARALGRWRMWRTLYPDKALPLVEFSRPPEAERVPRRPNGRKDREARRAAHIQSKHVGGLRGRG